MSIIPEVKCRRCGETYSALRSRCPNCGTRRVTQSGRTPGTTASTVKGTAAYERADSNTKWQLIFGLILVVAVIVAVIVMVSTSLNGSEQGHATVPTLPPAQESVLPTVEAAPTPSPTPTPTVNSVEIQYNNNKRDDITMALGDAALPLTAVAYPKEITDYTVKWTVADENVIKAVTNDDGSVSIEVVGVGQTTLTAEIYGVKATCTFHVKVSW